MLPTLLLALLVPPTAGLAGPTLRARLASRAHSACACATAAATAVQPLTLADVEAAARRLGCTLQVKATGPVYRLELLWRGPDDAEPSILGFSNGFTQPNGVAHLESIQIRRFSGYWQRSRLNPEVDRYAKVPKFHQNGLGLLLSAGVACWILEGCPFGSRRAELLAIMDESKQHAILVRYYRRLGFSTMREVGDGFGSFGDQIVWGGVGTLMEVDLERFRDKWSGAIRALGSAEKSPPVQPASARAAT